MPPTQRMLAQTGLRCKRKRIHGYTAILERFSIKWRTRKDGVWTCTAKRTGSKSRACRTGRIGGALGETRYPTFDKRHTRGDIRQPTADIPGGAGASRQPTGDNPFGEEGAENGAQGEGEDGRNARFFATAWMDRGSAGAASGGAPRGAARPARHFGPRVQRPRRRGRSRRRQAGCAIMPAIRSGPPSWRPARARSGVSGAGRRGKRGGSGRSATIRGSRGRGGRGNRRRSGRRRRGGTPRRWRASRLRFPP